MIQQKNDKIWAISLLIISFCSIVLNGANLLNITLPDVIVRLLGIFSLICILVVAYTTVIKLKK